MHRHIQLTQANLAGDAFAVLIFVAHDPIQVHPCGGQIAMVQRFLHFGKGLGILADQRREGMTGLMYMHIPQAGVQCIALEDSWQNRVIQADHGAGGRASAFAPPWSLRDRVRARVVLRA